MASNIFKHSSFRFSEAWLLFTLAIFLFVTLIGKIIGLPSHLGNWLWNCFHLAAFYIPFMLFTLGLYLNSDDRGSELIPIKLTLGLAPFLTSAITLNLIFQPSSPISQTLKQILPLVLIIPITLLGSILLIPMSIQNPLASFILRKLEFLMNLLLKGEPNLSHLSETQPQKKTNEVSSKERTFAPKENYSDTALEPAEEHPSWLQEDPALEMLSDDSPQHQPALENAETETHQRIPPNQLQPSMVSAQKKVQESVTPNPLHYPRSKRRWLHYHVDFETLLEHEDNLEKNKEEAKQGEQIIKTLADFKISAKIVGVHHGPTITRYELLPAAGVKVSKIESLADNIALNIAATQLRIVAPIPGKQALGIEVPNKERQLVTFKSLMLDEDTQKDIEKYNLAVLLGRDADGLSCSLDLSQAPHLLIAGSTGSGKSVCVNTFIASLITTHTPQELRLLLIDPKVVELNIYQDIPHLLTPVISSAEKAVQALQWAQHEMERRYHLLEKIGARNIVSYNKKIRQSFTATEGMEYVLILIDEFADLMVVAGKEIEALIARLAAMSRAVGIHLVLATQRPSVDVITGLIKANFPSRIAFTVASKTDSRIILDTNGAEQLLGQGDMLYKSPTQSYSKRIQTPYLSEDEVETIATAVRKLGKPHYIEEQIFPESATTE